MKKVLSLVIAWLLALPLGALATAQIPDEIVLDGQRHPLHSQPFDKILWSGPSLPPEIRLLDCTANWRGYRAFWTISDGKLLLDKVVANACAQDPAEMDLSRFFPDGRRPVAAQWFSGVLKIARGKEIEYVHQGYQSRYEAYTLLVVHKGVVVFRLDLDEPPQ